ncbi:HD domain-containing protein [Nocardia tenerifensis]|uniref:HD domain-containing protein n=1 Tax=Nocardia tenerifensis TaxID=228006 RepID=UPI0002E576E1|nr:HD domain-containing protein [Nocardia tenerifensis]
MPSSTLRRALTEHGGPDLPRLPERAELLLMDLDAPPRLGAHLRAVHGVARELADWVRRSYGGAEFDPDAVLFGAATHDIGKVLHPEELSGPGSAHELAGYQLLLEHGVTAELARFARTHATWTEAVGLEDLLVSLADKIWKGKRVPDLEHLVVRQLAAVGGEQPWQVFLALDDEFGRLAAGADRRLVFQSEYPIVT